MSSLQEEYNDWRDRGKKFVNFLAKNNLLGPEHKQLQAQLEENYRKLEQEREADPRKRLKIIRKRLHNYHKHKNYPYAYFPEEISEVSTLMDNAPKDIQFLLKTIEGLEKRQNSLSLN